MAESHSRGFTVKPKEHNGPTGKRAARRGQPQPGRTQAGRRRADTRVDAKSSFARYQALAQAAARSGNTIEAEYYFQHADHYFRVMAEQAQ